jgi:DNA-binding SARP family transcriptional activator/tetratricopeptide (TPR) repeat protein
MFAPVEVVLLGPLVVKGDDGEVVVSAAKQRALLELLALRSDQPLTSELLCAGLWGESEPATAAKALQTYVSHLRRLLPPGCLVTVGDGYALKIGRGSVDAARFEDAFQRSAERRAAGDLPSAAGLLADGLRLWRGPPCRELSEHSWATAEVVRLEELRRGAEEDLVDVRIALGQHGSVVGDLEAAVAAEPLRERRWGQLMLALYRSGRQAEALRAFQRARHILADELGIDPSLQLVALDQDIVAQAPGLAWTGTTTAPGPLTDPSTRYLQPDAGSGSGVALGAVPSTSVVRPSTASPRPAGISNPSLPGLLATAATSPLVGRRSVLQAITDLWEATRTGSGSRAALFAGEPGVGKTRIAAELAREASAQGAVVLYGSCDEDLAVPYQPFVEALQFYSLSGGDRLGALRGELTRLVPELGQGLAEFPRPVVSDPRTEEYRLFEAVSSWLIEASQPTGLMVVLDDLHWGTKSTLSLLVHLLKRATSGPAGRVFVVGTYRDTELDDSQILSSALADLRRLPRVERIQLSGLSPADVISLVEGAVGHDLDANGRRLAESTFAETDGNPFFVAEILRHLVETGQIRGDGGGQPPSLGTAGVPAGIREVVRQRVGRLPVTTRKVLAVASVIGRDFDLELLGTVTDSDEMALLDVLDQACKTRLIEEASADSFRFCHVLLRNTLYRDLTSARRRHLHRQVMETLTKLRRSDLASLAHHAVEAALGRGGAEMTVSYVIAAAGQAVAARALSEAEVWYRQALDLLDGAGMSESRLGIEALCGLGQVQLDQGDLGFRQTLLDAGNAALRQGQTDLAARAGVSNFRGLASIITGVDHERVELLEATLTAVGDEQSTTRALLLATWAAEVIYDPTVAVDRRLEAADRAVSIARQSGDARVVAEVMLRSGPATLVPERWAAGPARSAEAVIVADAAGDPTLQAMTRGAAASAHLGVGDFDSARSLATEALRIAERDCPPFVKLYARWISVQYLAYQGDLNAADQANDDLREFARQIGSSDANLWHQACAGSIANLRATGRGGMADLIGNFADRQPRSALWRSAHASALAEAGRTDEAVRIVHQNHLDDPASVPEDMFSFLTWSQLAIVAMHAADARLGAALEQLIRPYQALWSQYMLFVRGPMCWFLAASLAAQGRWDEAIDFFDLTDGLLAERHLEPCRLILMRDLARALATSGTPPHRRRATDVVTEGVRRSTEQGLDRLAAQFHGVLAAIPPP